MRIAQLICEKISYPNIIKDVIEKTERGGQVLAARGIKNNYID
jgi:hypothetical protein